MNGPTGKLYRRYLRDYTADLARGIMQIWESGEFEKDPAASGMYRGMLRMLREIETIKFAQIELFYRQLANLPEDEEPDAAKRPAQD